jgi:multiple sugar transport system substrate-binding protein
LDGKQYRPARCFSNVVLIYNKDLFDQAGSIIDADWTWTDADAAAAAIRDWATITFGIFAPITTTNSSRLPRSSAAAYSTRTRPRLPLLAGVHRGCERDGRPRPVSNVQRMRQQQGHGRLGLVHGGNSHDPHRHLAFNTFTEGCNFNWISRWNPAWCRRPAFLLQAMS